VAEPITIILAARDAEAWLAECLDSICAQTDPDWRLLALNDASRDGTGFVLEAYSRRDGRIEVLDTHVESLGVPASLNRLLGEVGTPLLARTDADDLWMPERLASQRELLCSDSALSGVTCRVEPFPSSELGDGMRRYFDWQNELTMYEEVARDRFVESTIAHPTLMLRTEALRSVGGWQDPAWPEDWDLHLRLLEQGHRIARVDRVLYRWRMHAAQLTQSDSRYSEDAFLAARAHYLARYLHEACSNERPFYLLGAGPVGKRLAKALAAEGSVAAGFVDVDPKKIGGLVHAGPNRWPVISMEELFALEPRPMAVSAVGQAGGRLRVRDMLGERGWLEGRDFVVAA
jgi:glycosyltransferase involved in cell wall biosynthesis